MHWIMHLHRRLYKLSIIRGMVDDRTGLIGCRNTVGVPGECMIDDKSGGRYENLQMLQICDSVIVLIFLLFCVLRCRGWA